MLKHIFILLYILLLTEASAQLDISHDSYLALLKKTYQAYEDTFSETKCDAGEPLLLTPLINENKLNLAREAAKVSEKIIMENVESYSGYLTVNEEYKSNLWFWYFPVMNKSVQDTPLLLWLQGGPGVSSMYGLFEEVGPFTVNKEMKLNRRQYSWNHNHSLLFFDNPVGTGFSFSKEEGYATNQTTISENLYSALQQFMKIFSELRNAPLFLVGESYAGKHIPSLGFQIHRHKNIDEPINMQGLAIGNGLIDPLTLQVRSYFLNEVGLIDDNGASVIRQYEEITIKDIKDENYSNAFSDFTTSFSIANLAMNLPNLYNFMSDNFSLRLPLFDYLQQNHIRKALHVGCKKFHLLNTKVYSKLQSDFMVSAKGWLNELLDNYRVLLYNGYLDTVVAYHPSVHTYNSLSFSGAAKYKNAIRKPWLHKGKVAGYYKQADNLLEVMVRGAGHMVPEDEPEHALVLIESFVRNVKL